MLQNDIILLIKASGQQPPVMNADMSMIDMLEQYAETTGWAKMSPGKPNIQDLRLLQQKV